MRIPLSWLRELCPTELAAEDLAELLTSRGAEVEGILRPWGRLSGVVAARVVDVRDHPASERLCVARVSTGASEHEVVVGVRNMAPGDIVALAPPGATVPGLPEPLAERRVQGVASNGMLCSPMELGVAPQHDRILILPATVPPGDDVAEALGLSDAVLDIEVTANRPDFLSVLGIAREVSAATGVPLAPPDAAVSEADEKADEVASVEVVDPERCPRYLARIARGVRHVASPLSVQARLTAAGMRPISAAVDATNYAMIELGQPLHPFDLALLRGPEIVVRRAADGEAMTTLDGVERRFTTDDLLIADAERPIAIAGVMGGAAAEVSEATSDILLESAWFERRGVQRTRRRIGLSTEASIRFERGTDPEGVPVAAERACRLLADWCGARILAGAIEVGGPPPRRRVSVRPARASLLLGFPVAAEDAASAFDRLAMPHEADGDAVVVEVPGYRVDVEREVDLIEEIVRVAGYDRVGSSLPPVRQPGGVPPGYAFAGRVRDAARRAGLREIVSSSFVSRADLDLLGGDDAVRVANPLAADEGYLRTRLLPVVLRAVARNQARGASSVCVFEVGSVFGLGSGGVEERRSLALALAGTASQSWSEPERPLDLFDAKGALEALLAGLGVRRWSLDERGAVDDPAADVLHPGRSAAVVVDGSRAGVLAELRPSVAAGIELTGRVAVAELDIDALERAASVDVEASAVGRHPPVRRDLAFVVDDAVPAGAVRDGIVAAGGDLLAESRLFDVYRGEPIPPGRKSLAFAVQFRADRTLTDEEVEPVVAAIAERLATDLGAELRAR